MSATYLAGYDGSPESHAAVDLAVRLAKPADADVTAVHVYENVLAAYWFGVQAVSFDELEEDLRREAEELLERLDIPGVGRQVVRGESPARGLHDTAQATGAELISVGATHHGPFGRLAPGSVGMHLLHGAPCPVAVSPADAEARPLRRIGVAYDGRDESKAALAAADKLAVQLGAELVLLGALQPLVVPVGAPMMVPGLMGEEAERSFRDALDRATGQTRAHAEARGMVGPAAQTIAEASGDVDLLVTGSRGYGAVRGVVLGSVSRHLVDHAACPVLVVPRPEAR